MYVFECERPCAHPDPHPIDLLKKLCSRSPPQCLTYQPPQSCVCVFGLLVKTTPAELITHARLHRQTHTEYTHTLAKLFRCFYYSSRCGFLWMCAGVFGVAESAVSKHASKHTLAMFIKTSYMLVCCCLCLFLPQQSYQVSIPQQTN